ncbi:hypothetical protein B0H19DRAFT_1062112 [Mycena capillaripes]|nr:hypothetical protein B0H19DRAFT_1062112 [Mycena capillaripes]
MNEWMPAGFDASQLIRFTAASESKLLYVQLSPLTRPQFDVNTRFISFHYSARGAPGAYVALYVGLGSGQGELWQTICYQVLVASFEVTGKPARVADVLERGFRVGFGERSLRRERRAVPRRRMRRRRWCVVALEGTGESDAASRWYLGDCDHSLSHWLANTFAPVAMDAGMLSGSGGPSTLIFTVRAELTPNAASFAHCASTASLPSMGFSGWGVEAWGVSKADGAGGRGKRGGGVAQAGVCVTRGMAG